MDRFRLPEKEKERRLQKMRERFKTSIDDNRKLWGIDTEKWRPTLIAAITAAGALGIGTIRQPETAKTSVRQEVTEKTVNRANNSAGATPEPRKQEVEAKISHELVMQYKPSADCIAPKTELKKLECRNKQDMETGKLGLQMEPLARE